MIFSNRSEQGKQKGVKTPFNDKVVATIKALGVGFAPDPRHLDAVIAMLPNS